MAVGSQHSARLSGLPQGEPFTRLQQGASLLQTRGPKGYQRCRNRAPTTARKLGRRESRIINTAVRSIGVCPRKASDLRASLGRYVLVQSVRHITSEWLIRAHQGSSGLIRVDLIRVHRSSAESEVRQRKASKSYSVYSVRNTKYIV